MQKSNTEPIIRKMPFQIDIELVEGTVITDGVQILTNKEASHIKFLRVDHDGFLVYEISLPKKSPTKAVLSDYLGQEQLIASVTTVETLDGQPLCVYKYYKRPDGSYYASISGKDDKPRGIELGKITERESPIGIVARNIAFKFDDKKFSRNDLIPLIPKKLTYTQRIKSILDILHREGFLIKEVDPSSRNKAKELYTGTEKLKKSVIAPVPEQT